MEDIEKLTKELEEANAKLEEASTTHTEEKEALEKQLAEKDVLIKQKTDDVIGARKKYQKLSDMSEEEKEAMTEKELELQQRQEEFDARQEKLEKDQKEQIGREITARREAAVNKLAGDDAELAEKINSNFGRLSESKNAQTEAEIQALAADAYNMLGTPNPVSVDGAMNAGGDGLPGDTTTGKDFAESERGKDLAGSLGLTQAQEGDKPAN